MSTQLNEFFIDFLINMNLDSDIIEIWETEEQEELDRLLNKIEKEIEKEKKNKTDQNMSTKTLFEHMNVDYDITDLWEIEYEKELNQLLNEIEMNIKKKFNKY